MIRVVKLSFKSEHIHDFKLFFDERKMKIRSVEGCSHLELWQDIHDEGVFFTYSIWNSNDDLNRYRESELFQETWGTVKQWFKQKPMAFSSEQLMRL